MFIVCSLYHFVRLEDPEALRQPLLGLMARYSLRGTILLAPEGINGSLAGSRDGIDALLAWLRKDARFASLRWKESASDEIPFHRARVKLKREIVTMGVGDIDPNAAVGTYVTPAEWNQLIADPNVAVIDTRNDYEVQIGTFRHATNPNMATFREFPDFACDYADQHPAADKHRKVAMFCTGGIRCEKATAYLKSLGFDQVYHLEGGILKYLEEIPEEESLWQGECFVFDGRVTVTHGLKPGHYDQCHACRMPIGDDDKQQPAYVPGVSCPHCIDQYSDSDRLRFREREKQLQLAEAQGDTHLGHGAAGSQQRRKQQKYARRFA